MTRCEGSPKNYSVSLPTKFHVVMMVKEELRRRSSSLQKLIKVQSFSDTINVMNMYQDIEYYTLFGGMSTCFPSEAAVNL